MPRTREEINEYNRNWRAANYEQSKAAWQRQQKNNPVSVILRTIKHRAKQRGLEFNLEYEDVVIPEVCPVFGFPLVTSVGQGAGGKFNSPSLDRIDSNKGYIKGNVQVISNLANSMKSTASPEQLKMFAAWINKEYA